MKIKQPTEAQQKEQVLAAHLESVGMEYCCGSREYGNFSLSEVSRWYKTYYGSAYSERKGFASPKEAWSSALDRQLQEDANYPVIFHIVRDSETTKELVELLKSRSDCSLLHSWVNPNSGNTLDMYLVTNNSSEDYVYYEDNDSDY